mgnify:CR=1 FL=1
MATARIVLSGACEEAPETGEVLSTWILLENGYAREQTREVTITQRRCRDPVTIIRARAANVFRLEILDVNNATGVRQQEIVDDDRTLGIPESILIRPGTVCLEAPT